MTIEEIGVLSLREENLDLHSTLDTYVKCTICETQCLVMRVTDLFTGPKYFGPQAERYRKGGQIVDSSIDYCSLRGTCTFVCLQDVKVTKMIHHAHTTMKREKDIPPCDHLIGRTEFIDTVMAPVAPIASWALDVKAIRTTMGKVTSIRRNTPMPRFASRTLKSWFKEHTPLPGSGHKRQIIFFHGCAGQYFEVGTSTHSVQVLGHFGYEVLVPHHGCCGPTLQSNGPYDEFREYVSRLTHGLRKANRSVSTISMSDSYAGMLRHEADEVLEMDIPELRDVGLCVWDTCEFLVHLHDKGELDLNFRPMEAAVPCHTLCQLKPQGLGLPAVELMELIPGVAVGESNQPYCGIAGTYGIKKGKYDIVQAMGRPVFDFIKQVNVEFAACDTETCRWQLRATTGANVVHPIWFIHKTYGPY